MKLGAVEIDTAAAAPVEAGAETTAEAGESVLHDQYKQADQLVSRLEQMIHYLGQFDRSSKPMFAGKRQVSTDQLADIDREEPELIKKIDQLEQNQSRQSQLKTELSRVATRLMYWNHGVRLILISRPNSPTPSIFFLAASTPRTRYKSSRRLCRMKHRKPIWKSSRKRNPASCALFTPGVSANRWSEPCCDVSGLIRCLCRVSRENPRNCISRHRPDAVRSRLNWNPSIPGTRPLWPGCRNLNCCMTAA